MAARCRAWRRRLPPAHRGGTRGSEGFGPDGIGGRALHPVPAAATGDPRGARPSQRYAADILVFSPAMSVGSLVQVNTRTMGADRGWHMSEKHERLVHDRLFYAFLDLEPVQHQVFIIPCSVVRGGRPFIASNLAELPRRRRSSTPRQQRATGSARVSVARARVSAWLDGSPTPTFNWEGRSMRRVPLVLLVVSSVAACISGASPD